MHEYSIVSALLDRVDREAQSRRATAVHRVYVSVGELSGVEVDLLHTAFTLARQATLSADAELEVTTTPASWACPGCRRTLESGERLSCPDCALPARLLAGGEIQLDSVEMEVP